MVIFPSKSSFSVDFRMTSSFLPGGITWVISFLRVHPKGLCFLATLLCCAAAVVVCVRDSDPQSLAVFLPPGVVWVLSLPLFSHPCEDKLNRPVVRTSPFLFKFSFFTPASWHPVGAQALHFPRFKWWLQSVVFVPCLFGFPVGSAVDAPSRGVECGGSRRFLFTFQMPWEVGTWCLESYCFSWPIKTDMGPIAFSSVYFSA